MDVIGYEIFGRDMHSVEIGLDPGEAPRIARRARSAALTARSTVVDRPRQPVNM
jgi:hypothetical protein